MAEGRPKPKNSWRVWAGWYRGAGLSIPNLRLRLIRCSLTFLLTIAFVLAWSPSFAFQLLGIKFFERSNEESKTDETIGEPQNYSVDFSVASATAIEGKSDSKNLAIILKGASSLWKDKDKPASGASGLLAKARGDYRRLLSALYGEGRYGGSISILVDGREAANVPPDAVLAEPAKIRIVVDPGPPFLFGEATIVKPAPRPITRGDIVLQPEDEGFAKGELARSGIILKAGRLSIESWRQQGYAKAKFADQRVTAAHDTDRVKVTLTIEPGRKAFYGPIEVKGTDRMDPAFVAWMTGLTLGLEYDPDDLERANNRLQRLGVFRSARLEEAEVIDGDGLLPVKIAVQERPLHRYGIGASYSTLDGAGFETYWLHRNLFGHAESLRLEAKVSGIDGVDPRKFTYRAGATYIRPGVYTPDTDLIASLLGEREVLDIYTRTAITASVGFKHMFSNELSARLFLNGGPSRFEDDFGRRDFLDVGLLGGITYDGRDNKTDATSGIFAEATVQPFYEFTYGNPAMRMTAEGRTYYGFGEENRVILAGRLKVGSLLGPDISEIAPDKLFFSGGGGSVRGYAYRSIGVDLPGGRISGGRSLIEASGEVRTRVTSSIGLVGFVDAGYVGAKSFPDFAEVFRVGAGLGVRYLTGFGPLRADVAVPLNRRTGDPTVAFYVGIGQAF